MTNIAINYRWLGHLNGIISIIFGSIAILFPAVTLGVLALFFAVSLVIGGVALIIGSLYSRGTHIQWYYQFIEGLAAISLGGIVFFNRETASAVFVALVGIWAIFLGLMVLITYYNLKKTSNPRPIMLTTSIFFLLIGIFITFNPFQSSRLLVVLIGIYALAYGVYSIRNSRTIGTK